MADICCGVVSERKTSLPSASSSSSLCEPTSRDARRRRMEIRRFKVVPGVVEASSEDDEDLAKRQKLEVCKASFSWTGDGTAVENCLPPKNLSCGGNNGQELKTKLVMKVGDVRPVTGELLIAGEPLNQSISAPAGKQDGYPKYGVASVCGRRRDMEDAVAIRPSFCRRNGESAAAVTELHYFGVYDGHGCSHVASRCRLRLHELLKEELHLDRSMEEGKSAEWKSALERSFGRMDNEVNVLNQTTAVGTCRCELQTPECDAVGSTATVAVVTPEKIIVANCGDSRAVLCRNGKPIPLSTDHKPDRPDELERIQAAGGRVIYWDGARVLGVLAMSRAIGDNYLKPYVISEPEVTITDRSANDDDCLIIASDGLWDVVSNDTACGVARMCLRGKGKSKAAGICPAVEGEGSAAGGKSDRACSDAAMLLTKLALARHSSDNVSVVVVDLRRDT